VAPVTGYAPFTRTPDPWLIAHRGGAALYPEEGRRGYDHSLASGFALEADARQLQDGTWVLLHDDTVDRTMSGVSGPIDELTVDQWRAAYLKPGPAGRYASDRPLTLDDFLVRYGGRAPIVLEHKGGSVDDFIRQIQGRGLQTSVMAQSFSWTEVKQFQAAGLIPMYLMGRTIRVSPADIAASAVRYVGVSKDMNAASVAALRSEGLVVISYTVDTRREFDIERREGVRGAFSDNPWSLR
jgi:glycerophosphoryl diester phosphodiesterase